VEPNLFDEDDANSCPISFPDRAPRQLLRSLHGRVGVVPTAIADALRGATEFAYIDSVHLSTGSNEAQSAGQSRR
jgi:hypothetical protein